MAFLHNHLEIRFAIILFKLHEILRKIIKVVATRCRIVKLKVHQIRFRLGYSAPQTPSWI